MGAEEKLATLQAALTERGVKDVKFFLGAYSEKPLTQLAADAADILQAIVDGKVSDFSLPEDDGCAK